MALYGHVTRGLAKAGLPINEYWFSLVDSVIYSFHMPLFFFLSGLFFYDSLIKRGKTGLIFEKLITVIYPYILWSLLQGLCEVLLSKYTNGELRLDQVLSFAWEPRAQFWFLYALFLVFFLCSNIYLSVKHEYFLPLVVSFGVLFVFKEYLSLIRVTDYLLANTVFFAFGVWFNEVKSYFEARSSKLALILFPLFICGQYLFHSTFGLNYRVGGLPMLLLTIISIFFIVTLSMAIGRFHFDTLLYIGSSSMTIYLMHILAASGARVIFDKIMGIHSVDFHIAMGLLVGLAAPLLVQRAITRYKLDFLLTWPRSKPRTNAT